MSVSTADTEAVLKRLASLDRAAGSPGEREAAMVLADELARRGARSWIESEPVHGTYWVPIGLACGAAALAGLADRRAAAAVGALAVERVGATPVPMLGAVVGPALIVLGAGSRAGACGAPGSL